MDGELMLKHMKERGISEQSIEFLDYCGVNVKEWLTGFSCVLEAVRKSVELIRDHPLTGRIDRLESVSVLPVKKDGSAE